MDTKKYEDLLRRKEKLQKSTNDIESEIKEKFAKVYKIEVCAVSPHSDTPELIEIIEEYFKNSSREYGKFGKGHSGAEISEKIIDLNEITKDLIRDGSFESLKKLFEIEI